MGMSIAYLQQIAAFISRSVCLFDWHNYETQKRCLSSSYTLHLQHQPMYGQLMTSYALLWQQPANTPIIFCIHTKRITNIPGDWGKLKYRQERHSLSFRLQKQ